VSSALFQKVSIEIRGFRKPVTLYGLHPHMHGRGKDFEYRLKPPAREEQTLLRVPNYRATWQPDPTKEVTWGDQTWDEMMVGFFNVVFDAGMPLKDLFAPGRKPRC
jgi:hypothetical protein